MFTARSQEGQRSGSARAVCAAASSTRPRTMRRSTARLLLAANESKVRPMATDIGKRV